MYQYNKDILDRNIHLLNKALQKHQRILMIRFDVRYPKYLQADHDNHSIVKFIKRYRQYFARLNYDPLYLWCREKNHSHNHHYHVYFFLDATKLRFMPNLKKADEIWNNILNIDQTTKGLIQYCNPAGLTINRENIHVQQEALEQLSYLAKIYSKQHLTGVRDWGSSSI